MIEGKHVVVITVENYHGLTAALKCADHEDCGIPEVFGWDSAAAMESYHGEPIRFEVPAEITGVDEESGIDWQQAKSAERCLKCGCGNTERRAGDE